MSPTAVLKAPGPEIASVLPEARPVVATAGALLPRGVAGRRRPSAPALSPSSSSPATASSRAALPWPVPAGPDALKPMRAAGAYVALVDGALALYVGRGEKEVTTFLPADEPARATAGRAAALAIARWAAATGRVNLAWEKIDGRRATGAPLAPFMAEAGVVPAGGGFRIGGPESGRFGSLAGGRFWSESRVVGGDEG